MTDSPRPSDLVKDTFPDAATPGACGTDASRSLCGAAAAAASAAISTIAGAEAAALSASAGATSYLLHESASSEIIKTGTTRYILGMRMETPNGT